MSCPADPDPCAVYTREIPLPTLESTYVEGSNITARNAAITNLTKKMALQHELDWLQTLNLHHSVSAYAPKPPRKVSLCKRAKISVRRAVSRFVHWLDEKYCDEYHDW